ncbi:MAG: tRNA (guanosine(37)-N1)-methyltransferase TrmD [Desulfovibrionaceae bacterium]
MHFNIISLFPEFFDSPLSAALMGKARQSGILAVDFFNPRDHTTDNHHSVDDRPYGGGPGMVMLLDPLVQSLRSITPESARGRILVMAPSGEPFCQAKARQWALEKHLTLVCGRYEGIDARLADLFDIEYVNVGDAVLNGGETAALHIIEAVSRLVPGFMGKEESGDDESFSAGLLEYPHYTRPEAFEGHAVPEILRSGDHARIAAWRHEKSLQATLRVRPALLAEAPLNQKDAAYLDLQPRRRLGRNLNIALLHYPVIIEGKNSGCSSLTNLDIHDIARSSCTYGLGGFYVASPLDDQMQVLADILHHWTAGAGGRGNADRKKAFSVVRPVRLLEDAVADLAARTGQQPLLLGTSARWADGKDKVPQLSPSGVRQWLEHSPVLLILGTGHGLAPEVLALCDGIMRPIRYLDGYNHLSVRAAAAIVADRILGDIY